MKNFRKGIFRDGMKVPFDMEKWRGLMRAISRKRVSTRSTECVGHRKHALSADPQRLYVENRLTNGYDIVRHLR